MNLLQLVFKQMRQRALGTWLTLLSVVLGVALGVAVLSVRAGSESLLSQTDFGYDLIIGKGSPTQLVLNTVYHIDSSPGNIPYSLYEQLANPYHPFAKLAVPIAVGDTYENRRIVATLPKMFGYDDDGNRITDEAKVFRYRPGKRFELAAGRMFHPNKFEAIIGSEVTELSGLKIGDEFVAVHGAPDEGQPEHSHQEKWKVVGVLQPTQTSNDRVIFTPLVTSFAIDEHRKGAEAQAKARAALEGKPAVPGMPGARPQRPFPPVPTRTPAPAPAPTPATTKSDEHDHDDDHKHEHKHDEADADEHKHAEDDDKHADEHDHKHEHADDDKHADVPKDDKHADHADAEHEHKHEHGDDEKAVSTQPAPGEHDDHHGHVHEGVAHEHESYHIDADGVITVKLPKEQWLISAILVKTREVDVDGRKVSNPLPLQYVINATGSATAVMPAQEMSKFLRQILRVPRLVMLIIACLVTVVAAVGILVGIYNSVSARMREIAILRALGATQARVLLMICLEAGLIGLAGAAIGFVAGHLISAIGSAVTERLLGQSYNWMAVAWEEPVYLAGVVVLAVLAGLVPALKAYRTPVATNLVAT